MSSFAWINSSVGSSLPCPLGDPLQVTILDPKNTGSCFDLEDAIIHSLLHFLLYWAVK